MKNTSLLSLQKSLIALSDSNSVHYEVTAQQIRETRIAILAAEGVDMSKFLDYTARLEQIEKLDAEIAKKSRLLESLRVQVEEMQMVVGSIYQRSVKTSHTILSATN